MQDMKIQRTSVTDGANGAFLVEIAIAHSADITTCQEYVSARAEVGPFPTSLLLDEVRQAALRRVHQIVGQHIDALAQSTQKARGLGKP